MGKEAELHRQKREVKAAAVAAAAVAAAAAKRLPVDTAADWLLHDALVASSAHPPSPPLAPLGSLGPGTS